MAKQVHDVILIYGGRSTEHEISCKSAAFVLKTILALGHNLHVVGISKSGAWYIQDLQVLKNLPADQWQVFEGDLVVDFANRNSMHPIAELCVGPFRKKEKIEHKNVVVFPVIHGTGGEDGSIQGLLDYANLAYVGPDLLGSAIGMDKDVAKKLVAASGIKVVPSLVIENVASKGLDVREEKISSFIKEFGFPIFVKPAKLGSSVGVSKATNLEELESGSQKALFFDDKILLEQAVSAREIEVGVIGHSKPEVSAPGEVIVNADFYSFDAKYVHKTQASTQVPASLTESMTRQVQDLALKCYQALGLSGMARIDFFLDKRSGEFIFNEVNTIPGFTEISLFPLMWLRSGLGAEALVSRLLMYAFDRHSKRSRLERNRK